jgi:hypothetical protein
LSRVHYADRYNKIYNVFAIFVHTEANVTERACQLVASEHGATLELVRDARRLLQARRV